MAEIVLKFVNGVDALARIMDVMRRAKVVVISANVMKDSDTYSMSINLSGNIDELRWLAAKLERLPEVMEISLLEHG